MNLNFLKYYFENQLYVENPPLDMKNFIRYCEKRGIKITEDKLEKFEKEGWFYPLFRVKDFKNKPHDIFLSLDFNYQFHNDFTKLLNENYIYLPQNEEFIEFAKFFDKNDRKRKIQSYYSNFQIHHLIFLLKHENYGGDLSEYLNSKFIDLMIGIQIYAPFGRSNMHFYKPNTPEEVYFDNLKKYDLTEVLKTVDAKEDDLFKFYAVICRKLPELLGSEFAIQLWKNIAWHKKEACIGQTRLGIEYLQWAMMLKKCIETHIGREIYDVDEIDMSWEDIKNNIPSEDKDRSIRGCRNEDYTNELTDEYEFNRKRKRMFYLANSLTLDYHPKIILFVEGKTEKIMIPKFFEFYGYNCNDFGIEIIDIGGILKLYNKTHILNSDKPNKSWVNNFRNLIQFNLDYWQAIPFFIGDRENGIIDKIKKGELFDTEAMIQQLNRHDLKISNNSPELNSKMIEEWTHIWETDFESDNYTFKELENAAKEVCGNDIKLNKNETLSKNPKIKRNKIEINKKAFDNLVEYYKKTKDETVWERPIFKIIDKLLDMSILNPSPVNTQHKIRNKKELYPCILQNYDIFRRNLDGW